MLLSRLQHVYDIYDYQPEERGEWVAEDPELHIDLAAMSEFIPPRRIFDKSSDSWKRNYVVWLITSKNIMHTCRLTKRGVVIHIYEDTERCNILIDIIEYFSPLARYSNLMYPTHCLKGMYRSNNAKIPGTITLTFGEQAEGHHGMRIFGDGRHETGLSYTDLEKAKQKILDLGGYAKLYDLSVLYPGEYPLSEDERPYVLVIRRGIEYISDCTSYMLMHEQSELNWDRKAWMRGRVVNKRARFNLVYGDNPVSPIYEEKEGRVVPWNDIPYTSEFRDRLSLIFGDKADKLQGEGNYYYDTSTCGIGYHGDAERRVVIAARMGDSIPIHYQWYQEGKPVGENVKIKLHDGDVYAMSDKATGHDWKKRKIPTLRHATGCAKYTTIK